MLDQNNIATPQAIPPTDELAIAAEQQRFMTKVYAWMSFALLVTGLIAKWIAVSPQLLNLIFSNEIVFPTMLISQILLVVLLVSMVEKMSSVFATIVFILYATLTGVTFSSIFVVFTEQSIASTFYITAGTFAVMSLYGYLTKTDLTHIGNLLLMGLIGLVIASLVNLFWQNETLHWVTTYIGVLVFVGLTAYDTQSIKKMNVIGNEGTEEDRKEAIMGALTLYLDFINLFLHLLSIFGKKK